MESDDIPLRVSDDFTEEFPGADPDAAEAGANLVRTSSMWLAEVARRRREVADLSPSGFEVLAILEGAGEPLPSTVIADRLLVSTASMTSLLDTLERRGFVERLSHPSDRRKILVSLKPAAYEIVDRMLPMVHAASRDAFAVLSRQEKRTLVELLGRVQKNLLDVADRPPTTPPPRRAPRLRRR